MIRYSIVIPAYNAADTLPACLKSLLNQSVPKEQYEIIVVDDGSSDGTVAVAEDLLGRQSLPRARVLRARHRGQAAARNDGVKAAQGDFILFTDADCEPVPAWIERLAAVFADAGVSGAKGAYRTRQQSLVARFVQQEYEEKCARMSGSQQIDFIDTYSAAYRRDRLEAAGGFRPELPVDEDQELSFRLSSQGLRFVFVPEAVVYHRHVSSLSRYFRRKLKIGYWKVAVLRLHPDKTFGDAHTPLSLKLQILMILPLSAICLMALIQPVLTAWAAALLAAFLMSMLPLLARIARQDPMVLPIATLMICIRALALAIGFIAGLPQFFMPLPPGSRSSR